MFLLVKQIDGDNIIIGSAQKKVSSEYLEKAGMIAYEILDEEYSPEMIHSKIDSFEEIE